MPKRGYKRQPQPHQSPSLPTLRAAEIAAAATVGPDVIPIVGTPDHVGMVPISQPGGTFAVWADPLVQGLGSDGTPADDVNPVLISGKGPDGNQHAITVDPNGALDAKIRNEVDVHISDTVGQPVFSTNESLNVWVTGIDALKFDASGNLQVAIQNASLPVTGSVAVTNLPATQPVSGSVAVSNFPATQPVSATSLPLPANAAQETGGNLATAVTQQTANIEFQQQLILLLEAIRRGVTALACEGGRNNPQDFDLAAIAQELTQPDMLLN